MKNKVNKLQKMNKFLMQNLSEDNYVNVWLAYYPDEATKEDLEDIAADEESYRELVQVFQKLQNFI